MAEVEASQPVCFLQRRLLAESDLMNSPDHLLHDRTISWRSIDADEMTMNDF